MSKGSAVTPRGRFNLVMGLLVLAAVALGAWRWRQQARDAAALSDRIAAQVSNAAAKARLGSAGGERTLPFAAPQDTAPMPPWGEPLGANFDALRRRADAGDARAACRIGVELSLCEVSRRGSTRTGDAAAAAPQNAAARHASIAGVPQQGLRQGQNLADYCEGVDPAQQGLAASYLRKAALAGNRDAMLRYAQGAFFDGSREALDHNRYLQDPGFVDWYRDAVPTLQRALRASDPMAAQLLADAYADDHGLLDALIPDDPTQAFSYRLLLSYLRGGTAPAADALDPRQRADAEHQAQRIYRESFGSRPVTGGVPRVLDLRPDDPAAAPCS
jgi:hypothetical protein